MRVITNRSDRRSPDELRASLARLLAAAERAQRLAGELAARCERLAGNVAGRCERLRGSVDAQAGRLAARAVRILPLASPDQVENLRQRIGRLLDSLPVRPPVDDSELGGEAAESGSGAA